MIGHRGCLHAANQCDIDKTRMDYYNVFVQLNTNGGIMMKKLLVAFSVRYRCLGR